VPPAFTKLATEFRAQNERTVKNADWLGAQDFHITLRFLGPLKDGQLEELTKRLGRIKRPKINVETGGLDIFGHKANKVLYAAVPSVRKLTTLVADINDVIAPMGFDMPNKPFVPHITLLRSPDMAGITKLMKSQKSGILRHVWTAGAFSLYTSGHAKGASDANAAHYRKEQTFTLS